MSEKSLTLEDLRTESTRILVDIEKKYPHSGDVLLIITELKHLWELKGQLGS